MRTPLNASGSIEGIQILRAVAALMVVVHHARYSVPAAHGWGPYGEAGVDIFFVISGFVMSFSTSLPAPGRPAADRLAAIGDFLRKRAIRIVPLYWIALLWTSRHELAHGRFGLDLLKDALFVPRLNPAFRGWIAPSVQQGWTLNYEAFFYVLFALAMLSAAARTRTLVALLAGFALAGYLAARLGWPADADSTPGVLRRFYGDNIILEFGFGVVLERSLRRFPLPDWPRAAFWAAGAAGFGALALGHGGWPRGVTEGLPATLIVWAGIGIWAGRRSPVLELLGAASYAIYLFHWASFGAGKPLVAALSTVPDGPVKAVVLMAAHVAIAVASGLLAHWFVEKPLLRMARRHLGGARKPPAEAAASA